MWGKDKNKGRHYYDTLISGKTEFIGDLRFTGGLHIDGRVKGSVFAQDNEKAVVRISDHGIVEGEVRAPHVIINGQVIGDVYSSEHVELAANASVTGTVHYNLLEMVMGAQVNGSLINETEVQSTAPAKAASQPDSAESPDQESVTEGKSQSAANT